MNNIEIKRDLVLTLLRGAISACKSNGGGAIALVGASGYGKSTAAKQFIMASSDKIAFFTPIEGDLGCEALSTLRGLSIVDDSYRFPNIQEEIHEHVKTRHGVVVVICQMKDDATQTCGEHLSAVIPVSHWRGTKSFDTVSTAEIVRKS